MAADPSRAPWVEMLRGFTLRNAGRRTVLEVVDPALGAQREETDFPLRGVAYDPRDQRVEIMLGDEGSGADHLTHSISQVTALDVMADARGRDSVLRIGHGEGQTLLRLVPPPPLL